MNIFNGKHLSFDDRKKIQECIEKGFHIGGKTPYEAFSFFYGSEILNKLNIQKIEKDTVTLKPYLLKITQ